MQKERIGARGLGKDSSNGAHRRRHVQSRHPCHGRSRRLCCGRRQCPYPCHGNRHRRNGRHLRCCGGNPCRDQRCSPRHPCHGRSRGQIHGGGHSTARRDGRNSRNHPRPPRRSRKSGRIRNRPDKGRIARQPVAIRRTQPWTTQ